MVQCLFKCIGGLKCASNCIVKWHSASAVNAKVLLCIINSMSTAIFPVDGGDGANSLQSFAVQLVLNFTQRPEVKRRYNTIMFLYCRKGDQESWNCWMINSFNIYLTEVTRTPFAFLDCLTRICSYLYLVTFQPLEIFPTLWFAPL
jgi:hypothetical protein